MGSAAPLLAAVPFGIFNLTINGDGIIVGRLPMGVFVATSIIGLLALGCYLAVFPFFSTLRHHERVTREWHSPIDIRQAFHASELARSPEFSDYRAIWTKDHLRAAIIMRNEKYRLGVASGNDGLKRIGADIYCDEQGKPTNLVQGVKPRRKRIAHRIRELFKSSSSSRKGDEPEKLPLANRGGEERMSRE